MPAILALEKVVKSFGALRVTDGITLSVAEGETLGILGPNGAGKTTLFNLISGDFHADSGRVLFGGEDVTFQPPHRRCRSGIGRSYQIPQPFGAMTVFENLVAAASFGTGTAEVDTYARSVEILRETRLLSKANRLAGSLTLLDRKRLELARALATQPKVLLLDEIAGGLTEHECAALVALIKDIRQAGISIIWIEHIVHALLAVVDRLAVLHGGAILAQGAPRTVIRTPAVAEIYMGIEADA